MVLISSKEEYIIDYHLKNCKLEMCKFLQWLTANKYDVFLKINILYDSTDENQCCVYVVPEENYYCEITSSTFYLLGINIFVTKLWFQNEPERRFISIIKALVKAIDQEFSLITASAYSNMIVEMREEFVCLSYAYLYFIYKDINKKKLEEYLRSYIKVLWEKYIKGIVDFEKFYEKFVEKLEKHVRNFLKIRNLFSLHSEALYYIKQLLSDIGIPIDKENVKYII